MWTENTLKVQNTSAAGIGGFAGGLSNPNLTNCYSYTTISTTSTSVDKGAFAGMRYGNETTYKCSNCKYYSSSGISSAVGSGYSSSGIGSYSSSNLTTQINSINSTISSRPAGLAQVSDVESLQTAILNNQDIILTDNIDLSTATWADYTYTGSFDGAGFTISNLTYSNGLFAST